MTFKPAIWNPIATVLSVVNWVGVGLAAAAAEPWHATIHAGLALAFGLWAQRLRPGSSGSDSQARLELLESDLSNMRRELNEAQERLDFAERVLAQGAELRGLRPDG